jgi:hypothetical protein
MLYTYETPITVTARSKAWAVFARSNTEIVVSNPTRGMDVCVGLFCVRVFLYVGSSLATGWSPVQGGLSTVFRLRNRKSGQGRQGLYSNREIIINFIIIIIDGAVLSPYVSVQVPRYLLVPGTAATLAYCKNPYDRWGLFLEQLVEWKLAGETEVLGVKPTPAPLCPPQNPTWQTRSRSPDRSGGKPANNRLSYGAAFFSPISSPLTTRRVTVEVFDLASTRV